MSAFEIAVKALRKVWRYQLKQFPCITNRDIGASLNCCVSSDKQPADSFIAALNYFLSRFFS